MLRVILYTFIISIAIIIVTYLLVLINIDINLYKYWLILRFWSVRYPALALVRATSINKILFCRCILCLLELSDCICIYANLRRASIFDISTAYVIKIQGHNRPVLAIIRSLTSLLLIKRVPSNLYQSRTR